MAIIGHRSGCRESLGSRIPRFTRETFVWHRNGTFCEPGHEPIVFHPSTRCTRPTPSFMLLASNIFLPRPEPKQFSARSGIYVETLPCKFVFAISNALPNYSHRSPGPLSRLSADSYAILLASQTLPSSSDLSSIFLQAAHHSPSFNYQIIIIPKIPWTRSHGYNSSGSREEIVLVFRFVGIHFFDRGIIIAISFPPLPVFL